MTKNLDLVPAGIAESEEQYEHMMTSKAELRIKTKLISCAVSFWVHSFGSFWFKDQGSHHIQLNFSQMLKV